jgi:hypothetical protein
MYHYNVTSTIHILVCPLTAHQTQSDGRFATASVAADCNGDLVRVFHCEGGQASVSRTAQMGGIKH